MKVIFKYIFLMMCCFFFVITSDTIHAYEDTKQTADGWVYRITESGTGIMVCDYVGTETDVHIPESIENLPVTRVNTRARFGRTDIVTLSIPKTVEYFDYEWYEDGDTLLKIKTLENIFVDEENQYYKSIDGVLYSKDGKILVRVPMKRKGTYIVPDTVETIYGSAFSYTGITSIKIGKKVKRCGIYFPSCKKLKNILVAKGNRYYSAKDGVLYNKKKTKILNCVVTKKGYFKMPSSVKSIENEAFNNCNKLTKVKISDKVTRFGSDIFRNCSRLSKVIFGKKTKTIGCESFYGTAVKELVVPKSVKKIHYDAFSCAPKLNKVIIKGTQTDIREAIGTGAGVTYCVPKKALEWYKKQLKEVDISANKLVGI